MLNLLKGGPLWAEPMNIELSKPFVLKVGQSAKLGDLGIKLIRIAADTRCPKEVECEWAGAVITQVELSLQSKKQTLYSGLIPYTYFILQQGSFATMEDRIKVYGGESDDSNKHPFSFEGYSFQILSVDPYPTKKGKIAQDSYEVKMIVNAATGKMTSISAQSTKVDEFTYHITLAVC